MTGETPRCAITGANGYIGSKIRNYLQREGWIIYEMRHDLRDAPAGDPLRIPFSLEKGINPDALRPVEVLIHCAWDFRPTRWENILETNVKGSLRLFEVARAAGIRRIVFISTMSAFEGCRSYYGKAKLLIEKEALKDGGIVIRPGLVFGPDPGGTVGSLRKAVSSARIMPLVGRGNQIQFLAHEEDLCRLLATVAAGATDHIRQPIIAAAERGRTFREILQVLAEAEGRRLTIIPMPWRVIWGGLKVTEAMGLRFGLRSDSVIGLANPNWNPDFGPTRELGVPFRQFGLQALI